MPYGEVDNLNIKISADASMAQKALDSFAKTLQKLNNNFQGMDSGGIKRFSKDIGTLASSMQALGRINVNANGIKKAVNSISKLLKIDMSNFKPEAFTGISNAMQSLGNLSNTSLSVNRLISSFSRLANAGEKTGQSASGILRLGKETRKAVTQLQNVGEISNDVNMFVQSIGRLASAGKKTGDTSSNLGTLASEVLKFFNAMKDAPKISQNTLQMVQAMGQLASAGGRVSTSTSSISGAMSNLSSVMNSAGNKIVSTAKKIVSAISSIGNSGKSVNKLTVSFGQFLKGGLFYKATNALSQFGYNMFDLGSAVTEVENVVDVAFGSMNKIAYDFAETATEQFGLSELAAKQYAGTMMSVLNASGVQNKSVAAEMSTTLAGLAGDIASFYNIGQDVAWERIMSGMAGEIEPLRRLGINLSVANLQAYALSQGITKSWQSMTQAEQVMLRYNYLMAVTGAQQGDFARTSGTWANQIRLLTLNFQQLSATLGQGLIAAILPAIQALNALMAKLIQAAETFRNFIYTLVGKKVEGSQKGIVNDLGGIGDYSTGLEDIGSAGDTAAGGLDDAAGAAEELKKQLSVLPFDELNQLVEQPEPSGGTGGTGGGGGGGGGGLGGYDFDDLGSAFDDLANADITPIIEWAQRIRNAFLDHDWERLGEEIAWGINVGLEKIYDVLDWNNVGPHILGFMDAFTKTLNSLVEHIDWDLLGRDFGRGLNIITKTANAFMEGFDFVNLGAKLSEALRGALDEIDWNSLGNMLGNGFMISWHMLSGFVQDMSKQDGAGITGWEQLGKSVAKTINGAFAAIDFEEIADTVATGLNGALSSINTLADNIDFSMLGKRLANVLNKFFKKFNFKDIGRAINKWVNGILDTIIAFIDKTDWEQIGDKIGEFLEEIDFIKIGKKIGEAIWKAINSGFEIYEGMFETAPLESALLSLVGITNLLKNTNINNFLNTLKNGIGTVIDFGKAIGGSQTSLDRLRSTSPKVSSVIDGLKSAFSTFKKSVSDGNWLTGIGNAFNNIRQNMSNAQKGAVTAISAFSEFSILKDTFKDLSTGTGDLGTNIAELAVTAATTGTAMYVALGPAGLAVTAITGLISLFTGVQSAMDEINTQKFEESVHNAFVNPGGTPLDEIAERYSSLMSSVSNGFSDITEASGELEVANANIESTQSEIERIQIAMDNGVISVEEGTEKLTELFGNLAKVAEEKFTVMQNALIGAFGEGGSLQSAYEKMGISTENLLQDTMQVNDQAMDRIKQITEEMAALDPSNPRYAELQQELYALMGTTDDLEATINDYKTFVDSTTIDYSNLITKDGLDSSYLTNTLDTIVKATQDADREAEKAVSGIKEVLTNNLQQALNIGDLDAAKNFQNALDVLPQALSRTKDGIANQAKSITDTIQTELISNMTNVIEDAEKRWEQMSPAEKFFSGFSNVAEYAQDAVTKYQNEYINPISDQIESSMNSIGVNGAGWAGDASKKIMSSLFDTQGTSYATIGGAISSTITTMNEDWRSIIDGAVSGVGELAQFRVTEIGNMMTDGFVSNLMSKSPEVQESVIQSMQAISNGATIGASEIQEIFDVMGISIPNSIASSFSSMEPEVLSSTLGLLSQIGNGQSLQYDELVGAFSKLGFDISDKGLIKSLASQESNVQQAAIMLLSQLESGKSLSEDQLVYAFESLGVGIVNDGIIDTLANEEPEVQKQAIDLLGQIQSAAKDKRQPLIDEFDSLAVGTVNQGLIDALDGMNIDTRNQTIDLLSQISGATSDERESLIGELEKLGLDVGSGLIEGIGEKERDLSNIGIDMADTVMEAMRGSSGFDTGSPSKKAKDVGADAGQGLIEGINGKLSQIGSSAKLMVNAVMNKFGNLANDMYQYGRNAGQSFSNGFKSIYIPTPHMYISGWKTHNVGNGSQMSTPNFSVSWYKTGGLFREATIAGIGEDGEEAVLPLENRKTMNRIADSILSNASVGGGIDKDEMRQTVAEAVAMALMNNQGNQQPITVYAELRTENDEVLARAVTRGQQKLDYRMNPVSQF